MTEPSTRLLAALALLALPAAASAQQATTITGTVTAASGGPLPAAQVFIQDLDLGGQTGADGRYTITVPAARATGQTVTLTARRIGYQPATAQVTLTAGQTITQDFQLTAAATQLEGVVVTALGIEREKKALGVAQQQLSSEQLTATRDPNLVNQLAGKIAGATITNAGTQGGSSRIVLRGGSSLTGNNQPLFVVDGIPVDNSNVTTTAQEQGGGGYDFGNAIQDLNPDDIASVSVLKGPNAAALYGARAANGAIIITTKRGVGANGLGITAGANVTFDTPLRLPEYQNLYGQGTGGQFEWVDGAGGGIGDGTDESWGPRLDGTVRRQFFGEGPWVASPDNIENFLRTGQTSTINAALTGSSEKANFRASVTNQDIRGLMPNNTLRRLSTSVAGGAQLNQRLSVDASVSYTKNQGFNRPGTGYDGQNPMQQFIWFGRQVDLSKLKNPIDENGNQYNWNYNYHNNPYWLQTVNSEHDVRDRIIGVASVKYELAEGVNATFRTGTDWYRDRRQANIAAGTIGNPFGGDYTQGGFFTRELFNRETNTDLFVTAQRPISESFDINATVGTNLRRTSFSDDFVGTDKLVIPGTYNIGNSAVPPTVTQYREAKHVNGVYGQLGFGFRDYLFVDVTGRNDWSSTLPKGNNSYFYPSVSSSFVFTEAVPALTFGGVLGYGKLRAAWTRVGNDAPAYYLYDIATQNTLFGDVPRLGVGNRLLNPDLKPEQIDSWEVGTELNFLDNRIGLDLSYYNKTSTNQILPLQVSATSGYTSAVVNAGKLSNRGIEAQLNLVPVRLANGFEWVSTINFAKNKSEVMELPEGFESIQLGSYWSLSIEAREGQPYGALYGNPYLRDEQGNLILNSRGRPQADPQRRVLGNYTPDWTGGWNNQFRYKGFNLGILFDTQQGGDIFSVTNMFGRYAGVLKETLVGREESATQQTLVIPGVLADGTPNTIATTAEGYNHALYGIHEAHIFDASFIKLRELRLGYTFSQDLASRLRVSGLDVALVGRNLWLSTDVPHIDPETAFSAGNVQGIEFGQLPSVRSFGIQLNVTP